MQEIVKYHNCFVCGDENPHGLQARFYVDGDRAVSEIKADDMFEGYRGIYHGGVISAMLDEVMIKALLAKGLFAVTAEMTVKFKRPLHTGAVVRFAGWATAHKGRVYFTEGEAVDENGEPYATATGKYIEARGDLREELTQSLD